MTAEDPMEPEKPLHVKTAEALGWFRIEPAKGGVMLPPDCHPCMWKGVPPGTVIVGAPLECVPRYDLDWEVTGPVLESMQLSIGPGHFGGKWIATTEDSKHYERGETALEAICALIVKLGGKVS